jgi:hypothetical protein
MIHIAAVTQLRLDTEGRADPEIARTGVDLVADLELTDLRSDLGDDAGEVVAEGRRVACTSGAA